MAWLLTPHGGCLILKTLVQPHVEVKNVYTISVRQKLFSRLYPFKGSYNQFGGRFKIR